jgi:hypothetical protein
MAEVTKKESRPTCDRTTNAEENRRSSAISVLTTAISAVCFLLAFTFLHGTEQLLLASVGALLAGGVR